MNVRYPLRALLGVLIGLLLLACGPLHAESLEIERADGSVLVKLTWDGEKVKIKDASGEALIKGKPRDDGGRKYKDRAGILIAKVGPSEDGFKLKTERGGLLWKVKYYGDKIKVSAREDNEMADELRRKSATKWSLRRGGEDYAKVKYYPDDRETKLKDGEGNTLYRIRNENFSPLLGVLAIPAIPAEQAYVIMAEIWRRGW